MQAYRVKQWNERHETSESRKIERLRWVSVPNKHDGLGFRHIVRQKNRNDLFAAWKMILEVASRGEPPRMRGWLVRNGKPLTADELSLMTGLTTETFETALEFFTRQPADWLEIVELPADSPESPAAAAARPADSPESPAASSGTPPAQYRTGQDSTAVTKRERRGQATSAEIAASRTQAGALIAQIKAAEARGGELSGEERTTLRKNRAALARLQQKQAQGDFAPEPVSPNV